MTYQDALGPSESEHAFVGGLGSCIYCSYVQLISETVLTGEGQLWYLGKCPARRTGSKF